MTQQESITLLIETHMSLVMKLKLARIQNQQTDSILQLLDNNFKQLVNNVCIAEQQKYPWANVSGQFSYRFTNAVGKQYLIYTNKLSPEYAVLVY